MSDSFDDQIRDALRADADGVTADDALLDRIRTGSERRARRRAPWLLAAASVVALAGIAAALTTDGGDGDQTVDVVDQAHPTTVPVDPDGLLGLCATDEPFDVALYMQPDASADVIDAMAARLAADDRVASQQYVDQEATYAEFQRLFADSPELLESVEAEILPPSFRIDLARDADLAAVGDELGGAPGVYEVVSASDVCTSDATTTTAAPSVPAERPTVLVAVTRQARVVVLDAATGAVVRDLGGFDDPTDPEAARREGGPFSVTGVALHPRTQDVYVETCCEPAAGAIFRVPIDGTVPIGFDTAEHLGFGFGIDLSADGRWLASATPAGPSLLDLETGRHVSVAETSDDWSALVQVAVNRDGTEITAERALEYGEGGPGHEIVRSELVTFHREGDALVRGETTGGDVRLLPVYSNGGTELTTLPSRNGVIDLNVDASGHWFLVTRHDAPLRGYAEATDDEEIPGGPYLAADW